MLWLIAKTLPEYFFSFAKFLMEKNYYYPNFEMTFKNVFGETLKNLEKEFVDKINGYL